MARTSRLTAAEIEAAEKAADERRRSRSSGFSLMHDRDKGWHWLSNGALLQWHTDRQPLEGEGITKVEPGKFLLTINGKTVEFDVDEFQKWLRWA